MRKTLKRGLVDAIALVLGEAIAQAIAFDNIEDATVNEAENKVVPA